MTTLFQLAACAQAQPEPQVAVETTAICEPQVAVSVPAMTVTEPSHEAKLAAVNFAEPDTKQEQAPRKFKASAYSIHGRTRSGVRTQQGTIAADPRVLPLGTVVQVSAGKYSGVYTVHDTGGAIKGNRVDVWLPSNKEARRFGRRAVKLVVLTYPGKNKPGK
ncbi:MAG: 3D domain-containing protein [Acidobacteria bacterium]|nr:3D domain-containing protein [Acidobacteriota bacterium]